MLPPHLARLEQKAQRRQAILNQGIPLDADQWLLREIQENRQERRRQRALGRRQTELERIYQGMHTKLLLQRLDYLRSFDEDLPRELVADELIEEFALKKVLATREHVMNKPEAHRHRQYVAVRQHGQGKSRDR